MKFNTQLLHGNAIKRYPDGATLPPISQVSAFAYETAQDLEKVFNNRAPGYAYTRISNPVVDSFERRVCELEAMRLSQAADCLVERLIYSVI